MEISSHLTNKKKLWTMDETCKLIESYRNLRCLWNPKHPDYKNRMKKRNSLEELAKSFNVPAAEVERKLNNLNSQHRRERRKYKEYKQSGACQHFQSQWFAYNLMTFLEDKSKPTSGSDEELDEPINEIISNFSSSDDERFSDKQTQTTVGRAIMVEHKKFYPSSDSTDEANLRELQAKKTNQKLPKAETKQYDTSKDVFKLMMDIYKHRKDTRAVDDCDIFGQLVARKLKNLKTFHSRNTVQNMISNIIYQAELGVYDAPTAPSASQTQNHDYSVYLHSPQTRLWRTDRTSPAASN